MWARTLNNRLVVTDEDVGIFCALLEFVGKRMNEDGTLPGRGRKGCGTVCTNGESSAGSSTPNGLRGSEGC